MDFDARPETARRRLLYMTHRTPCPPDKGDRIRCHHLLRWLSERFEVDLASLSDEPVRDEDRRTLRGLARRVHLEPIGGWKRRLAMVRALLTGRPITEGAFDASGLTRVLRDWAETTEYDRVLVSAPALIAHRDRVPRLAETPLIVDMMDVDSQKWFEYADQSILPLRWLYLLEGTRVRRLERELPRRAEAVLLISEQERTLYREFAAPGPVRVVSNGVDLEYFQPQVASIDPTCAFLGALDYFPNIEGITWFVRNVWPSVRQRRADARLLLIGRRPTPTVQALAREPGVELVGQVPDVRPPLARASVSIVPLTIGRGVQNKVLESLALGKATITSTAALTGLEAEAGRDLVVATTPESWRDQLLELWENPKRREALGRAGRRYVEARHAWSAQLGPLAEILDVPKADASASAPAESHLQLTPIAAEGIATDDHDQTSA